MKRHYILSLIIACVATTSALAEEAMIPVLGKDALGRPAQVMVPAKEYMDRFGAVLGASHEASLVTLNKQSERDAKKKWRLRMAIIGVGVSGEIGFGPFKVGAYPRFRLVFSNSLNPPTP